MALVRIGIKKERAPLSLFLLFVAVIAVKDCKQRNIEHKNTGQDPVFEYLHECDACICVINDKISDQADDNYEVCE